MFKIKIAGINILVDNKYPFTEFLCREYFTTEAHTDIEVRATDEAIKAEIAEAEIPVNEDYAESVCIHREIAERLAEFDAFVLHSAFISCEGKGIAFTARSGVGKSTHVALWKKNFRDRVTVVNGDKPIVRFIDGVPYGFGTPWLGKENEGENSKTEFSALCFLQRGETNMAEQIPCELGAMQLLSQVYIPKNPQNAAKTLELVDRFSSSIAFFRLACNMHDEAAIVSHNTIMKGIT